jgi:hypothetical protein
MATGRRVVDTNERATARMAEVNLQTAAFLRPDRSSSSMDSGLHLSDCAGAETRTVGCHREAQDIDAVPFADSPDGNAFDLYVGVTSAIGLSLVIMVAVITAVSLLLLIQL